MPNFPGGPGPDFLTGTNGDDTITGLGGDDRLNGNDGRDQISGGEGNDALYDGTLTFSVSNGSFTHSSDQVTDILDGGAGDDVLYGGLGDAVVGGTGFDRASLSLVWWVSGVTVDMRVVEAGGTIYLPGSQFTGTGYATIANGAYISGIEQIDLTMTDGADTFYGLSTADTVRGGSGADTLNGGAGDDLLIGGPGDDIMRGEAGDDTLGTSTPGMDGSGVNTMEGGDGDDLIYAGASDHVDGGAGTDRVYFSFALAGTWDLSAMTGGGTASLPGGGSVRGVESVTISAFTGDIVFTGSSANESVNVLFGAISAQGGDGDDALFGGMNAFNDTLYGDAGDDTLSGGAGDDMLYGGDGDDLLYAGPSGTDVLNGGAGNDTATFVSSSSGIYLDVSAGVYANTGVWTVFQDIEVYQGSNYADTMLGSAADDVLLGAGGNDVIIGLGGNDAQSGGAGDDWLDGGDGDDFLEGGEGVNILIGGEGLDLASYASQTASLWIDLTAGVYAGPETWDVFYQSIDGALGGSGNDYMIAAAGGSTLMGGLGDDTLIGGGGNDHIVGGDGADWIVAGAGDDRLTGGLGVDIYTGGAGADVYALGALNAGWDVSFDFDPVEDRFDLDGQLWLGLVAGDWDGDGQEDDTMLGYNGGNFVALDVSGMTLDQWNALVVN